MTWEACSCRAARKRVASVAGTAWLLTSVAALDEDEDVRSTTLLLLLLLLLPPPLPRCTDARGSGAVANAVHNALNVPVRVAGSGSSPSPSPSPRAARALSTPADGAW